MAQNNNASASEMMYQQVKLSTPITVPANGSVTIRIIGVTKDTLPAQNNGGGN